MSAVYWALWVILTIFNAGYWFASRANLRSASRLVERVQDRLVAEQRTPEGRAAVASYLDRLESMTDSPQVLAVVRDLRDANDLAT